jgi:hypothetical protein
MFREAEHGDFEDIIHLYRQLQPEDPVLENGSDAAVFEQILRSPWLKLSYWSWMVSSRPRRTST